MARFFAIFLLLGSAGLLSTAQAATVGMGYVIVTADQYDFATLNMYVRANNYANPYWPLITDVQVISANAQLSQGANPQGAAKVWDVSSINPLTSSIGESLTGGDGFSLNAGITSALIQFTVNPLGSWDVKSGPNFNPAGGPQFTALLLGTGPGGALRDGDSVELLITGDFDLPPTPEPSTIILSLSAFGALWLRRRRAS